MAKTCKNKNCSNYDVAITRDVSKFCSKCGDKLSEVEVCGYCEHEIYPTDNFCEQCGRPVK